MRERRPLFGYGLQRSGMSAVYRSVCERVDFSIRFDTLWHSCGISTRQWKAGVQIHIRPVARGDKNYVRAIVNQHVTSPAGESIFLGTADHALLFITER